MKSILFYDTVSPRTYTINSLSTEPLGGAEATVIRVAKALSGYTSIEDDANDGKKYDTIVTLRSPVSYKNVKALFPRSKHILWLHDHVSGPYRGELINMINNTEDVELVFVSNFHRHNFIEQVKNYTDLSKVKMHVIHNPVVTDGTTKSLEYDKNKLVFFSSPHKGLTYTLTLFEMIRRIEPEMRLYVANPGYRPNNLSMDINGVVNLGELKHTEMMNHVSTALALFYPNYVFPETFGLVMAEANALGVPVLTHPLGAANEVLSHPKETMDVRDYKAVVDRVIAWRNGDRPTVKADPRFALENVIKQWKKIL